MDNSSYDTRQGTASYHNMNLLPRTDITLSGSASSGSTPCYAIQYSSAIVPSSVLELPHSQGDIPRSATKALSRLKEELTPLPHLGSSRYTGAEDRAHTATKNGTVVYIIVPILILSSSVPKSWLWRSMPTVCFERRNSRIKINVTATMRGYQSRALALR